MAHVTFSPPYTPPSQVVAQLRDRGYAVLQPRDTATWVGCALRDLEALGADWSDLDGPADMAQDRAHPVVYDDRHIHPASPLLWG